MATPKACLVTGIVPDTFHVWLIGDGFREEDRAEFEAAASAIQAELLSIYPFTELRHCPSRLALWSSMYPCAQRGARRAAAAGTDTVLGAQISVSGVLTLDPTKVMATLQFPPIVSHPLEPRTILNGGWWSRCGLAVVLLPPESAGTPLSAEAEHGRGGGPFFIASTTDGAVGCLVARQIGLCSGLAEESDQRAGWPTPRHVSAAWSFERQHLASAPNLAVGLSVAAPDADFKWWSQVRTAQEGETLRVTHANGSVTGSTAGFAVFEGGGGYQTGIYRSAADCLMRRQIGGPGSSSRLGNIGFCEACARHLERAFRWERTSLATQMPTFASVNWAVKPVQRTIAASSASFAVKPAGTATRWTFQAEVSSAGGLVITDLRLVDQAADSHAEETVAERIEFRDLMVEFGDGTKAPFPIGTALASTTTPPLLREAGRGERNVSEAFQGGVDLTLTHDFGGKCPVELRLSFAVRPPALDFEPTGGILAAKFIPQISWRWHAGGTSEAVRFRGAVRCVFNNKVKIDPQHAGHTMVDETIVSFFTDLNPENMVAGLLPGALPLPGRNHATSVGTTPLMVPISVGPPIIISVFEDRPVFSFPLWGLIFNYHRPDLRTDTEIVGVHGPRSIATNAAYRAERKSNVTWPPGFTWSSRKLPRQGAYDNIHLHGSMGDDPLVPGKPMVHAPGCAEACIHLHWRWGSLTGFPIPGGKMHPSGFQGWTDEGTFSHPASAGLPLVPPNQDVTVAITHPDTTRADPWGSVVASSTALDPKRKALWYTTDVTAPSRDEWQVMLPMGLGFAFAYRPNLVTQANQFTLGTTLLGTAFAAHLAIADAVKRDAKLTHDLYALSRWYVVLTATITTVVGPQIPTGDHITAEGKTLEAS